MQSVYLWAEQGIWLVSTLLRPIHFVFLPLFSVFLMHQWIVSAVKGGFALDASSSSRKMNIQNLQHNQQLPSMILCVPHYNTTLAVLVFYQTIIEKSPGLQSSSIAESLWSTGGINITHLAVTQKYLSTTPEIVPNCQILRRQYYCAGSKRGLYCCTLGE